MFNVAGDGGAEHVLLIDGFTPMMKTKDLEDLLRPYSSQGVAIRWVDDTTVLAVFRTPALGELLNLVTTITCIRHRAVLNIPPYLNR
jgi:predicted HD phosphohydrolase